MRAPTIDLIRETRRSARAIVRGNLPREGKGNRLLRLIGAVRDQEDWPWLREAIWRETEHWFTGEDPPQAVGPDRQIQAHRRLRTAGYQLCPECRTPLLDESTIARMERLRAQRIAEAQRFEKAVSNDG